MNRECIGGPLDGHRCSMGDNRLLLVALRSDLRRHKAVLAKDESEVPANFGPLVGRYVRFPLVRGADPRPDALRWIPYT